MMFLIVSDFGDIMMSTCGKAKKEYNYVRFFQILKSPTTPYLFGCIMFKYVELMRKGEKYCWWHFAS